MKWDDPLFCDGTKTCENGLDEPDFCQRVVVAGSDRMDGIYIDMIGVRQSAEPV